MDSSEGVHVVESKKRNTGWRPVHVVPGALVITDEQLGGRAEVFVLPSVKLFSAPPSWRLLVLNFVHLASSRALHHPMLGWRPESPDISWLLIKRWAFLDVLEHGQWNDEYGRTNEGGGCLAASAQRKEDCLEGDCSYPQGGNHMRFPFHFLCVCDRCSIYLELRWSFLQEGIYHQGEKWSLVRIRFYGWIWQKYSK